MTESTHVTLLGDDHRDRVWRDRNGDHWRWYEDEGKCGWQYISEYRWRFGSMHIPACGPFVQVGIREEYDDGEI